MKLSKIEKKIVTDIWTLKTKETCEALSKMIRKDVKISSVSVRRIWINQVPRLLNPKEVSFTLISTKIFGKINGVILLACSLKDILKLAELLLHKEIGYYKALDEENLPVIIELTNVLQGYYISYLVKLFGAEISWSSPSLYTNAYRAIEEFDFGPIYIEKIYAHMLNANFEVKSEKISFKMLLLFKDSEIKKVLEAIEEKIKVE